MYRSKYHEEKNASKSNALTSVGVALVLLMLGVFIAYYLINVAHHGLRDATYCDRFSAALHKVGASYSTISYVSITDDEPSNQNARIHLFKAVNFRPTQGMAPIADAYVKCEFSELDESRDMVVSYERDE